MLLKKKDTENTQNFFYKKARKKMEKEKLEGLLKEALNMEKKGYDFYRDISKKAKNEVTKKTFSFLADQEMLHVEEINNFYNAHKEKGEFPSLVLAGFDESRTEALDIFSKSIKELSEKIDSSDDDKKACEFAMEFEKNGYKYYEDMFKTTQDENLKQLLQFLLNEENKHYETISDLHTYISDSQNWFMYEEGSFPQG